MNKKAGAAILVVAGLVAAVGSNAMSSVPTRAGALPSPSASRSVPTTSSPTANVTLAPTSAPTPVPTSTPVPQLNPVVSEKIVGIGSEPTVSVGPNGELAIAAQIVPAGGACGKPIIYASNDSGETWTVSYPWTYQCQDKHAITAWGTDGRLWAVDAVGVGNHKVQI